MVEISGNNKKMSQDDTLGQKFGPETNMNCPLIPHTLAHLSQQQSILGQQSCSPFCMQPADAEKGGEGQGLKVSKVSNWGGNPKPQDYHANMT